MGYLDELDLNRVYGLDTEDDRGLAINPWLPFTTNRVGSVPYQTKGRDFQWSVPAVFREGARGWSEMLKRFYTTGEVRPEDALRIGGASSLAGSLVGPTGAAVTSAGGRRGGPRLMPPVATYADKPPSLLAPTPAAVAVPAADRVVPISHNMPPRVDVKPKPYFDEQGRPIQGAAYSSASQAALAQVKEAGPGAGPLDLSGDQRIPDIVQEDLPRFDPNLGRRKGVPDDFQAALNNPDVRKRVLEAIDAGVDLGAHKWYHNRALYDAFVKELGPDEGHKQFQKYMDYQSAASPGSDVPTNIRNASYYYVNPENHPKFEGTDNYYPYGHKLQVSHRRNADYVKSDQGEWGGWPDLEKNPKPPSYGTNLGGNLQAVAGDTHAMRLIVMATKDPRFLETQYQEMSKTNPWEKGADVSKMSAEEREQASKVLKWGELARNEDGTPKTKDGKYIIVYRPQKLFAEGKLTMEEALATPTMWRSKPKDSEYAALEKFYADVGKERGLQPGEAQSAAWAGGGKFTGLGTPSNRTFGQMHNERVLYTAIMRGETPEETLRKLIRGEAPLLTKPPGALPEALPPAYTAPPGLLADPAEARRQASQYNADRVY